MSKNVSSRVHELLYECCVERAKQEGFPTISAWLLSLVRYDLALGKPHALTGDFHKLSGDEQEKIDIQIAEAFKSGKTLGGTWLQHQIEKALEENGPNGPSADDIAQKLKNKLLNR